MKAFFSKISQKLRLTGSPRVKRVMVAIIGGIVLLIGLLMVFLPGPGSLVMIGGLAILATEFVWARRWLLKARELAARAKNSFKR